MLMYPDIYFVKNRDLKLSVVGGLPHCDSGAQQTPSRVPNIGLVAVKIDRQTFQNMVGNVPNTHLYAHHIRMYV